MRAIDQFRKYLLVLIAVDNKIGNYKISRSTIGN